jgi:hypothetical protein
MIPPEFISIRTAYSKLFQRFASEAYGRLAFFLCTGKLKAFWFDQQGGEHCLSADVWKGMVDSSRLGIFNTGDANIGANHSLTTIVVRKDDLATILPPEDNVAYVDSTEVGPRRKGGRPLKYDWDAIWAGIVWIQHEENLPRSQDGLIERVQRWYEVSFGKATAPGRTTLQPKIAKLLALMDGAEPSIVFPSRSAAKKRAVKKPIKSDK